MPRHVAILGAGPVGLDAALACTDAGWPFTVYEAGDTVAAHVRAWGHARLFTPWDLNVSGRMRTHFPDAPTGDDCPTGAELATRLLDLLAALPALEGRIRLRTRVAGIARTGLLKHEHIGTDIRAAAPFTLLLDTPDGEDTAEADLVLDCTGTYSHPNTLGDGGIPAPANAPSPTASPAPSRTPAPPAAGREPSCSSAPGNPPRPRPATSPPCPAPASSGPYAARHPTGAPYRTTPCPAASTSWTPPGPSPTAPTTGSPSTPAPTSRP
ncbi:hypothetical protein [Streptacidiphilus sp. PAMC 29251]